MKSLKYFLILISLTSCEFKNPAFLFSNYKNTTAENIVRAIKNEDIRIIKDEVLQNKVSVDFKDNKYEVSLLALSIFNNKKKSFKELLNLGADPNVENSYCVGPLNTAIRYNNNCDTYYIEMLLDYGAQISPEFFKKCNSHYTYDPIVETIMYYYEKDKIDCQFKILKLLTSKLNDSRLLFNYNDSINYRQNVIYKCLSTHRNIPALKYLIVDLGYEVPEQVFIDGTILPQHYGYKSLQYVLEHQDYMLKNSAYREKSKKEILEYLNSSK